MARGVVFAVAGAKGGVGKTTTSINLSAVLAKIGHDVVLVELDLAMANVGDFLNLGVRLEHGRDPTLHEVLAGTASVADATYEAPGGFDVVPSGTTLEGFTGVDINAAGDVVSEVRTEYDVVVLDTGAGLGAETLLPLSLADETILVSSPRVASVRDTKKTRNLVRHTGGTVAGIVFVKSGSGRSPGVDRIAAFLSVDLLGHIPEDSAVAKAQDLGRPVVVAERASDAATGYHELGSSIHERIVTLKKTLATAERDAGEAGDTALATDDETGAEGFAFVDDSSDGSADTDAPGAGSASVASNGTAGGDRPQGSDASERRGTAAPTAPTSDNTSDGRAGESSDTDTGTAATSHATEEAASVRRQQTTLKATTRRTSGRAGVAESGESVGATDDEIAERLASVDEEDDEDDEPTRSTDERRTADAVDTVSDESESESVEDDSWDSKQSATKRFIDRAIEIIDGTE